jgi:hypothetical protein
MKVDLSAQIKVDFEKAFSVKGTAVREGEMCAVWCLLGVV